MERNENVLSQLDGAKSVISNSDEHQVLQLLPQPLNKAGVRRVLTDSIRGKLNAKVQIMKPSGALERVHEGPIRIRNHDPLLKI